MDLVVFTVLATVNFISNSKDPYMECCCMHMHNNDKTSQAIVCIGTLISDQWILTSADCMQC